MGLFDKKKIGRDARVFQAERNLEYAKFCHDMAKRYTPGSEYKTERHLDRAQRELEKAKNS